jgi:hypothetical protein
MLGHQLGGGRHRHIALGLGHGRHFRLHARRGTRCRLRGRHAADLHLARRRLLAFGVDLGDHLVGDAAVAVVLDDLGEDARGRRGNLEHDLVGFDLDEDLVHGDGLAGLLLPLQERGLGHGFRQLRNLHFDQ